MCVSSEILKISSYTSLQFSISFVLAVDWCAACLDLAWNIECHERFGITEVRYLSEHVNYALNVKLFCQYLNELLSMHNLIAFVYFSYAILFLLHKSEVSSK